LREENNWFLILCKQDFVSKYLDWSSEICREKSLFSIFFYSHQPSFLLQ
jgi:hypothetical protein